ncbi:BatA domain-containing protein [Nanoarchaeota archaeon]
MVLGIPVESFFLDKVGLYALLALVPLIILYLIRPKPKERSIPSLMFFLKDLGKADRRSFFRRFTQDWLFWIQLLVLLILALAVAKPFINVPETSLADRTILVLDTSASMMTKTDGKTRFEEAKDIAKDKLSGQNTIILARNIPLIGKLDVDKGEASDFIKALEPSATSTGIYDAVRAAIDYAGKDTRVVVISDFIETEVDSNVNTVKKALKARGAAVEYISVANEANNIGIVDLLVGDEKTTVQVRNYYPEARDVTVKVGNIEETLSLAPGAADVFTFSTPSGVNNIELDVNDDFELDNAVFISTPQTTDLKVLVITNDNQVTKSNLWIALRAISEKTAYNLNMETAVPPKSVAVNHDIVILKDFDQEKVLPGVFREIEKQVEEKGAALIITPQRGMFGFAPLDSLLPVSYEGEDKEGADLIIAEPEIETLTKDVQFGHIDYYFMSKAKRNVRPIAITKTGNNTIIALQQRNAGKVIYYGIFDQDITVDGKPKRSTFKHDLFYPIFWKRAIDILTDTPSVETLNRRTGKVINLAKGEKVKTPEGNEVEGVFMLENQGVYSFKSQKIAANLLNSKESDVSGRYTEVDYDNVEEKEVVIEKPLELTRLFVLVALVLLLVELFYTKLRGDM